MSSIKIGNVRIEFVGRNAKNGDKYKLRKTAMAGLIIAALIPNMLKIGEINENEVPEFPNTSIEHVEEEAGHHVFYLDSDYTNSKIDELETFGEEIRVLYIDSYMIDDLSRIAEYCPNIEKINLKYSPSISDLSFIYSLPNLKSVYIEENGYVTPELVEYLDRNCIDHNITQQDLDNVKELDQIISEIITEDMTDEEKIQAISLYVMNNYHYDIHKVEESNIRPLSSTLENKGGVCASYAYITNILLRKAGVTSYEVQTKNLESGHGWNLVQIDGKYYYLDTTNIDYLPPISSFVLEHLNIGFFYMTDPADTAFSAMENYDNIEKINIPKEMIEDIERGESEKNIIEKYGTGVPARIIELVLISVSLGVGISFAARGMDAVSSTISHRKYKKAQTRRKNKRNSKYRSDDDYIFGY